jgi:hypothetical protein
LPVAGRHAATDQDEDSDLENFCVYRDRPFAKPVRQKTPVHRKQNKGQRKERANERANFFFFRQRKIQVQNNKEGEVLENIVTKGHLELGNEQAPKSFAPTPACTALIHTRMLKGKAQNLKLKIYLIENSNSGHVCKNSLKKPAVPPIYMYMVGTRDVPQANLAR